MWSMWFSFLLCKFRGVQNDHRFALLVVHSPNYLKCLSWIHFAVLFNNFCQINWKVSVLRTKSTWRLSLSLLRRCTLLSCGKINYFADLRTIYWFRPIATTAAYLIDLIPSDQRERQTQPWSDQKRYLMCAEINIYSGILSVLVTTSAKYAAAQKKKSKSCILRTNIFYRYM